MSSPRSLSDSLNESITRENESMDDNSDANSWEQLSDGVEEEIYTGPRDQDLHIPDDDVFSYRYQPVSPGNTDLHIPGDDVFSQLRSYLDQPDSPGNTTVNSGAIGNQDPAEEQGPRAMPSGGSSGDEVLSVTRNLARLVRHSFAGVSPGLQGAGRGQVMSSFDSSSLSLSGSSRASQVHNAYNFNVVLLDPGVDKIPRRSTRKELGDNGRIVQLSLARGAQESAANEALVSAFPLLRGMQSRNGDDYFEILVTDKTSRNNLIPANAPDCGFTARELHKVAGQGSLYLRLVEAFPSQSQSPMQQGSSTGRRSRPGFVFRQSYLSGATTGRFGALEPEPIGRVSGSDAQFNIASSSNAERNTTSGDRFSFIPPRPYSSSGFGRPSVTRSMTTSTGTISTSTSTSTNGPVAGTRARLVSHPGGRGPSGSSNGTHTIRTNNSSSPISGSRLYRLSRGRALQGRPTSTRTTSTTTISSASAGRNNIAPIMDTVIATSSTSSTSTITDASATSSNATTVMVTASVTTSTISSTSSTNTTTIASARSSNAAPVMVTAAVTSLTSSSISITNSAPAVRSGSVPISLPIALTSIATNSVSIHTTVNSNVASATNTTNVLSSSVTASSVPMPSGMGGGSNHVDGGDALQSNEGSISSSGEVEQNPGRRWRATLPIEVDDSDADDGAGLETEVSMMDNATPPTSTCTPTTGTVMAGTQLTTTITTIAVSRPSIEHLSASITGTIELPEASVLLDLLPPNQGQMASALQTSISMTQSARLPFNHPCTFHVLMEMVRICGQSSRPALMCVCSERQWLLWRPIFEHRDIANVVNEQFLFWVQSSDGASGKQGLEAIQHHSSSGMVAVVCNVDGCQKVLRKITELPSVSEFQRLLEEALKEFQEQKRKWLALKAERDLKKEQDLAFAESLKADKEKELRKKNTKGCQCELLEEIRSEVITTEPPQQECSDEQPQQESNEGQRQENANEPPAKRLRSEGELQIAVVLPDGKRHILDVPLQNTLKDLYQQVRNLLPGEYVSASIALHCPLDRNVTRRLHESSMRIQDVGLDSNVVVRVSLNENDENRSQET